MGVATGFEGKSVLLSSFRNEAPFVLEFVAHHKVLGFDQIIIASNDCTDGTTEILDALAAMGVIHHLPCVTPPKITPQHHAYAQARCSFPLDQAEWLMILDADELLNVHISGGQLSDLIRVQEPDTDLILINWASFGSGGHDRWVNQPSSQRFTQRLRTMSGPGLIKSLIRQPGHWSQLSNHHPFDSTADYPLRIAFAGGLWTEDVAASSVEFGTYRTVKPQVGTFRFAQINHYITRTEDSFDLRRARGRGAAPTGKSNDRHTGDYFARMSQGTFEDDTISRYADRVAALTAEYLTHPPLAQAVHAGLRHYEAEIARYWQNRATLFGKSAPNDAKLKGV